MSAGGGKVATVEHRLKGEKMRDFVARTGPGEWSGRTFQKVKSLFEMLPKPVLERMLNTHRLKIDRALKIAQAYEYRLCEAVERGDWWGILAVWNQIDQAAQAWPKILTVKRRKAAK